MGKDQKQGDSAFPQANHSFFQEPHEVKGFSSLCYEVGIF